MENEPDEIQPIPLDVRTEDEEGDPSFVVFTACAVAWLCLLMPFDHYAEKVWNSIHIVQHIVSPPYTGHAVFLAAIACVLLFRAVRNYLSLPFEIIASELCLLKFRMLRRD
ncbi:hypothetical protein GF395_00125 [Candidatus Uhrbacteria bacterium]|nr:hypothetical protein [Candidatus Uhrbacteria bacterium]